MTNFIKNGIDYRIIHDDAIDIRKKLPPGCYTISTNPLTGEMYFTTSSSFTLPSKMYGDTLKHTDRIIKTFEQRESSTGVLLSGEKGSGKTMLSKNLSMELMSRGIPTIIINNPFHGEQFNQLIQSVDQPAVVLFDEFEKVYDDDDSQNAILTLLDGLYQTKKLFLLTCNEKYRINPFMLNRPGRLYYHIEFGGLDTEFVREYCLDNLINQQQIESVCNFCMGFGDMNFDILQSLVEEMNRYDEPAHEAIKLLNARPQSSSDRGFEVDLTVKNIRIEKENLDDIDKAGILWINPMQPFHCDYYIHNDTHDVNDHDKPKNTHYTLYFEPTHLVSMDSMKGEFIFEIPEKNARLVLTKHKTAIEYGWHPAY